MSISDETIHKAVALQRAKKKDFRTTHKWIQACGFNVKLSEPILVGRGNLSQTGKETKQRGRELVLVYGGKRKPRRKG